MNHGDGEDGWTLAIPTWALPLLWALSCLVGWGVVEIAAWAGAAIMRGLGVLP